MDYYFVSFFPFAGHIICYTRCTSSLVTAGKHHQLMQRLMANAGSNAFVVLHVVDAGTVYQNAPAALRPALKLHLQYFGLQQQFQLGSI